MTLKAFRIIGIDPGLRFTGWGMVEMVGSRVRHIANGACNSDGEDVAERLASLYNALTEIFAEHVPTHAAIETTFMNKDAAGSLKLGQARGIALLVPALHAIPIGEYAPNHIKKTIVGVGLADKNQVAMMVKRTLPGVEFTRSDASDALAIALCHGYHLMSQGRLAIAKQIKGPVK